MVEFRYMSSQKAIAKFFDDLIVSGAIPPKVDLAYLSSVGLTSSNDRPIIPLLKDMGFLSSSGAPTEVWRNYRSAQKRKGIMASAVRSAYPGIFAIYPEPHKRTDDELRDVIRSNSSGGDQVVSKTLGTFKKLCSYADFSATGQQEAGTGSEHSEPKGDSAQKTPPTATNPSPAVNINISLQVPETKDPEVYERFFEAMRKHLLS